MARNYLLPLEDFPILNMLEDDRILVVRQYPNTLSFEDNVSGNFAIDLTKVEVLALAAELIKAAERLP